jgi:hypothetical protein
MKIKKEKKKIVGQFKSKGARYQIVVDTTEIGVHSRGIENLTA